MEKPHEEGKAEVKILPVTGEAKIKCSMYFRVTQTFLCSLFNSLFCSISLTKWCLVSSI